MVRNSRIELLSVFDHDDLTGGQQNGNSLATSALLMSATQVSVLSYSDCLSLLRSALQTSRRNSHPTACSRERTSPRLWLRLAPRRKMTMISPLGPAAEKLQSRSGIWAQFFPTTTRSMR